MKRKKVTRGQAPRYVMQQAQKTRKSGTSKIVIPENPERRRRKSG